MRLTVVTWAVIAAIVGRAEARPTLAIAGIEVASDSVGVDVEAVGVARELTFALRRAAGRPESPLQVIDPMVRADDVEALLWGKLVHDGDSFVATVHLSAVGADGDTVSYRAVIARAKTSSVELERWGKVIYQALLEQVDVDDKVDEPGKPPAARKPPTAGKPPAAVPGAPPAPGTPPAAPAPPTDPFSTRDPGGGMTHVQVELVPDEGPDAEVPAIVDATPFHAERLRPEPRPNENARRLFWISAGATTASALLWAYSAVRISDAEGQLERLDGCSNCDRAIEAANAQGNRWEGVSWLAGTATIAAVAATALFGYQGYIVGRRPAPAELVGRRAAPVRDRAVTIIPVVAPDRLGAGVTLAF